MYAWPASSHRSSSKRASAFARGSSARPALEAGVAFGAGLDDPTAGTPLPLRESTAGPAWRAGARLGPGAVRDGSRGLLETQDAMMAWIRIEEIPSARPAPQAFMGVPPGGIRVRLS